MGNTCGGKKDARIETGAGPENERGKERRTNHPGKHP